MKIVIIGIGMVGSAVKAWFPDALTYDTKKQSNTWEECLNADCFFVCVPSPYVEGGYDLSYLEEAIAKIPDGKLVVIKSTVNPGTTDYFQAKYPNKRFMFNPEFLTELSAKEDFLHPDMQILGVGKESYEEASKVILTLPPAPVMRIVYLIDAEWVKKVRNSYYSMKVVFFNQKLQPGETCEVVLKIPFIALESSGELEALKRLDFEHCYKEAANFWHREGQQGAQLRVPEPHLNELP